MRNPFARKPPAPPASPALTALTTEQEAELREQARLVVRPGFTGLDDAVVAVTEWYEGEDVAPEVLEPAVERIVGEEWAVRDAELAVATDAGDFERLGRAFVALADEGVLARMNFTCCQNCGTTEIDDERTPLDAVAAGPGRYGYDEWAYTFFHQQDAEGLGEPDAVLRLSFSAFTAAPDADPADVAAGRAGDQEAMKRVMAHTDAVVGRAVVSALVDQGLTVMWDGTAAQRIAVAVPEWRKPLPTD